MSKLIEQTINFSINRVVSMTSREIAEITGKEHKNIKRDCLVMFSELELDKLRFERIYLDGMNRKQTEYVLDEELTLTLVTGYSIKLRNAVIKRWKQLESSTNSLHSQFNNWCAKEDSDKKIGSIHGKGLAHRKKTKRDNKVAIDSLMSEMQLKLEL